MEAASSSIRPAFRARFVRAKVELKWPVPVQVRIRADAGHVEQTEFVDPRGKNHREPVALRTRTGQPGELFRAAGAGGSRGRSTVQLIRLCPCPPGRVIRLEPDQTVDAEFEPNFRDPGTSFLMPPLWAEYRSTPGRSIVRSRSCGLPDRSRGPHRPRSVARGAARYFRNEPHPARPRDSARGCGGFAVQRRAASDRFVACRRRRNVSG